MIGNEMSMQWDWILRTTTFQRPPLRAGIGERVRRDALSPVIIPLSQISTSLDMVSPDGNVFLPTILASPNRKTGHAFAKPLFPTCP